jgi:hypothetical protein
MDGDENLRVSQPANPLIFEMRLRMVTRNGKVKGENKRGMRVGIEEGKEMEKRSWENIKGREITEERIYLNN